MPEEPVFRTAEMTRWIGLWHPLTERFPTLEGDELRALAADIRRHGQSTPCSMDPEGVGLDGRSRVAACVLAAWSRAGRSTTATRSRLLSSQR